MTMTESNSFYQAIDENCTRGRVRSNLVGQVKSNSDAGIKNQNPVRFIL